MEKNSLEKTMNEAIPKMMEYMQELNQGCKVLGEKACVSCRAFFHKAYAPVVSWMTANGIEWNVNHTSLSEVKKAIEKMTEVYGPKIFEMTQQKIAKLQKSLIQKGKFETAKRILDTMFVSAKNVLDKDLKPAINFVCKQKTNTAENKKVLSA